MLTTLPLEAFVCRSVMTTYYFPDEPFNPNRHLLFTTSLVVTSMFLSLITCDLGAVFELIGATSAAALAYILPPLCYVKLSKTSHRAKIPAYLCIVFGTAVMVISLFQALGKVIKSKKIHAPRHRPGRRKTLILLFHRWRRYSNLQLSFVIYFGTHFEFYSCMYTTVIYSYLHAGGSQIKG